MLGFGIAVAFIVSVGARLICRKIEARLEQRRSLQRNAELVNLLLCSASVVSVDFAYLIYSWFWDAKYAISELHTRFLASCASSFHLSMVLIFAFSFNFSDAFHGSWSESMASLTAVLAILWTMLFPNRFFWLKCDGSLCVCRSWCFTKEILCEPLQSRTSKTRRGSDRTYFVLVRSTCFLKRCIGS